MYLKSLVLLVISMTMTLSGSRLAASEAETIYLKGVYISFEGSDGRSAFSEGVVSGEEAALKLEPVRVLSAVVGETETLQATYKKDIQYGGFLFPLKVDIMKSVMKSGEVYYSLQGMIGTTIVGGFTTTAIDTVVNFSLYSSFYKIGSKQVRMRVTGAVESN